MVDDFFAPLVPLVPEHACEIRGAWSASRRRTYASRAQLGSGDGPFAEVVDARWEGTIDCAVPLAGIAMLRTPSGTSWAKSLPPIAGPPIGVSLHAWANGTPGQASFATSLHGVVLPSLAVPAGEDLTMACSLGSGRAVTGRPYAVAMAGAVAFVVVLLPGSVVRTGRNRLWRVRDDLAASAPIALRDVLTRGRTGELPPHVGAPA